MATPALPFDPVDEAARHWRRRGWDEAARGMAAVTSTMRVQQVFLGRVDQALRSFELTFARYEVLALLSFSRTGSLPLGKVGERLQVHPASVTNAIDRLERQGLVARVPHPDDGRKTLAHINDQGRKVFEEATLALNDQVFTRLGLDDDQLDRLVGLLGDVRRDAGDFA